MGALLGLAGGGAALVSRALVDGGVTNMAVRYPVAAFLAYGLFLVLVRLWLWLMTSRTPEFDIEPPSDLFDISLPDVSLPDLSLPDLDLDELWAPVMLLLALVGSCLVGFYLLWVAPSLLTEILIEFALAGTLHHGLRRAKGRWLWPTLERTWLAMIAILVLSTATGWALQKHCPDAVNAKHALRCAVPPQDRQ